MPANLLLGGSGKGRSGSGRSGFMLLELVFTLFALTVCILPVVAVMVSARKLNRQAEVQTVAYQAARQELEALKAQSYGNRSVISKASFTIPANLTANFSSEVAMTGTYSIASYNAYTNPPVQDISVRVTWKRMDTSQSTNSAVELSSLLAKEPGK